MRMTEEEFGRELRYQSVMHLVRKMLRDGLITEEEYRNIDTNNRLKMRPITGDLLSGKSLICAAAYENMSHGKEAL